MRAHRPTRSPAPNRPTVAARPGWADQTRSFGFLVALVVAACGPVGIFDVPGETSGAGSPTTPLPTSTPRQTVSLPTLSPAPSFQLYTVKRGDTLLSIADRFRTSVLSLSYWNRERYRSLGPRTSHQVALTLDMGGRLDPAVQIMDWLIANDVKATIFPTGVMGTTAIGRQVLARVKAHPDLFAVGNHSWDHPDFRNLDAA